MDFQKPHMRGEDDEETNRTMIDGGDKKEKRLGGGKRGGVSSGGGGGSVCCQAEKCTVELTDAKRYHRRHKVCEFHAKAPSVLVSGLRQRFCQQCSRRRLAGHNERRRKTTSESQGEGSSSGRTRSEPANPQCRPSDQVTSRVQMTTYPASSSPTYQQFQIR
ncbi:hypothetical protein KSS87_002244 [Heliosperma pusillum]|nr:hypothetical protein KSS87_002244 [Heliosperma pusillum]